MKPKCEVEGCPNDAYCTVRITSEEHKGRRFNVCAECCVPVAPGETDIEALERLNGKE